MSSVKSFRIKAPFDQKETVQHSIVGPYSFWGVHEALQGARNSLISMKCLSGTAKTLAIERENFGVILK